MAQNSSKSRPDWDVDRDILAHMHFRPRIAAGLREMDPRLFSRAADGPVGGTSSAVPRAHVRNGWTDAWPQPEPPHV